jgi:hypothetical protein
MPKPERVRVDSGCLFFKMPDTLDSVARNFPASRPFEAVCLRNNGLYQNGRWINEAYILNEYATPNSSLRIIFRT